ncbi:UPF0481 protein At3g47200-like [Cornus florida]|uniref:UPF0481 protein At3g47200-like n=1 Tax=Cornus florida TaxID=4283 RepID=UPI0028A29061|nr:UPF0481 protein At3g47200-like [Cornus florida]
MERGHNNTRSHGMNEREDYVSIDIQEDSDIPLFDSMREMIDGLPPLSNDCCIYIVPKRMREINENAYAPGVVSIGPFHRGKEHLQAMEEFKPRYFQSFLNRADHRMTLKSCIRVAKEWEERARSYYAEYIRHARGVLEIPKFTVNNSTESLFRNLMALEQFHYRYNSYIIDYIQFMDGLIDTAKDAELLIQNEILDSYLSDCSAVATLFNNLTNEMILWTPNYFYYGIGEKLNEYCRDPKHKWRATFTSDYLSTPWKTASTIAAVILLGLTLIQAICSIVSL